MTMNMIAIELWSTTDPNGGYEWSEFHVYRHPRDARKYAVHTESGCSCNWYETPSVDDLAATTPLTKPEARQALVRWLDGLYNVNFSTSLGIVEQFNAAVRRKS